MVNVKSLVLAVGCVLFLSMGTLQADEKEDKRTPEEKAYQFRDGLFRVIEFKFGKMIEAKFAGDKRAFHQYASQIAWLARMIPEGFIPDSRVKGTKAKEDIWEDWDEFTDKAEKFKVNMQKLADPSYDITSFDPKEFGGDNCGACHRPFKSRERYKM